MNLLTYVTVYVLLGTTSPNQPVMVDNIAQQAECQRAKLEIEQTFPHAKLICLRLNKAITQVPVLEKK